MAGTYAEKWMIVPKARTIFHSDRDTVIPKISEELISKKVDSAKAGTSA